MVFGTLALAGFGFVLVWFAGRNEKRQRRLIDESEPVDAVITASRVGNTTPGNDGAINGASKTAHVTFEYEYDGERHRSTHIRPGGTKFGSSDASTAYRRASNYDRGDSVTAYVPPSDPRLGFLEQRTSGKTHRVLRLFGWGITAVGLFLTVVFVIV
jgi:hypothetical protein